MVSRTAWSARMHATAAANEAARQAAATEAEALRISYEARLEKLNQQVTQLMHSPPRGTLMLHSGALCGWRHVDGARRLRP
eukprot:1488296-Prymnesium_polylepis.1